MRDPRAVGLAADELDAGGGGGRAVLRPHRPRVLGAPAFGTHKLGEGYDFESSLTPPSQWTATAADGRDADFTDPGDSAPSVTPSRCPAGTGPRWPPSWRPTTPSFPALRPTVPS